MRDCGSWDVGSTPTLTPKKIVTMVKVLNKNIARCSRCNCLLEYNASDIEEKECGYGVQSYAGETYIGKFITCPNCGNKFEVSWTHFSKKIWNLRFFYISLHSIS